MEKNKINILELLETGKSIQIKPNGYSMYPMFNPNRDSAIIIKNNKDKLKRGDVVLYRRDESNILILHRIWKIKEEGIYLIGDNQSFIEGPLRKEQIKGILVEFIYKGKRISVNNLIYRLISHIWLILRPFRKIILKIYRMFFKNIIYNKIRLKIK